MDSLRYWIIAHARRRVPLRSGQHAGPRAARSGQAGRVLRHHPPGPGHLAGEADRRAVGPGRRRLPGGQLPGVVVRMERQIPRLHSAFLERRRRRRVGVRHAVLRLQRSVRMEQPPPARQHQLRHRTRRLHAATIWSPTTTSTTKPTAKTIATGPTTTSVGTAASKGPPTTRRFGELRETKKRSFLATLLLSQGVPMLLAGDEIGNTQYGNNNAYCQDNEISWLDWDLKPDQEALLKFTRRVIAFFHEQPVFPPPPILPRHRRSAAPRRRKSPGSIPAGEEMSEDSWNKGYRPLPGRATVRRQDRRRRPRRMDSRRQRS